MKKTLKFIVFATLFTLSFNMATAFSHGYHSDEEIQTEQRQDFIDEHTHY